VKTFLLLLFVVAAVGSASAGPPADSGRYEIILGASSSPKICNFKNARPVAVREFVKNPADYKRKCIALSGYLGPRALFGSVEDFYALKGSPSKEDKIAARVGLYADDQNMNALFRAERAFVTVVGLGAECSDFSGERVVMVLGYCHHVGGPTLWVSDFTPTSPSPIRRTRSQIPADVPDIEDIDPQSAVHARIYTVALKWLDVIRRADVSAYIAMDDGSIEDRYNPDALMHKLFASKRNAFGQITSGTEIPPFKAFRRISEAGRFPFYAYGCFCKTEDCADTWPAIAADATAKVEWPYACFRAFVGEKNLNVRTFD
jgi:hypothetical protein